jgi:hypothetical protein
MGRLQQLRRSACLQTTTKTDDAGLHAAFSFSKVHQFFWVALIVPYGDKIMNLCIGDTPTLFHNYLDLRKRFVHRTAGVTDVIVGDSESWEMTKCM